MMKYLLIIAAILICSAAKAQIFNKSATNNAWNRVKSDSAIYLPLDTFKVRNATQGGVPVLDTGRIAFKNGNFWGHNGTVWSKFGVGDLPEYVKYTDTSAMLSPYVKKAQADTLYITWRTKITPLMTSPALPIQPTDSIPQALGKLQAQINSFDGTYIKLSTATAQTSASSYIEGKMRVRSATGQSYNVMLDRTNAVTDDMIIGFKSVADTVGYLGLANKSLKHISLTNLHDNIRFSYKDTASLDIISLSSANTTGKINYRFHGATLWIGDSLTSQKNYGRYPIHVIATNDTSAYFEKSVVGFTETVSDNSRKIATTAFVKGQNYTTAQTWQQTLALSNTATSNIVVNASTNSAWAATFANTGTTNAHGIYINIGSSSTGIIFRADKNGTSKLAVQNDGSTVFGGAIHKPIVSTATNLTVDANHSTIIVTAASVVITLPAANTCSGRLYVIQNASTTGNITTSINFTPANGTATNTIPVNTNVWLQSDGTIWRRINN